VCSYPHKPLQTWVCVSLTNYRPNTHPHTGKEGVLSFFQLTEEEVVILSSSAKSGTKYHITNPFYGLFFSLFPSCLNSLNDFCA